jgi:Zn finger protein HypA/HybF involved in hydrogenase expression
MAYIRKTNRVYRLRGIDCGRQKTKRLCLNCESEFMSEGPHNRICPKCKFLDNPEDHGRRNYENIRNRSM